MGNSAERRIATTGNARLVPSGASVTSPALPSPALLPPQVFFNFPPSDLALEKFSGDNSLSAAWLEGFLGLVIAELQQSRAPKSSS